MRHDDFWDFKRVWNVQIGIECNHAIRNTSGYCYEFSVLVFLNIENGLWRLLMTLSEDTRPPKSTYWETVFHTVYCWIQFLSWFICFSVQWLTASVESPFILFQFSFKRYCVFQTLASYVFHYLAVLFSVVNRVKLKIAKDIIFRTLSHVIFALVQRSATMVVCWKDLKTC